MEEPKKGAEVPVERPCSCEISVNAKGQWSGKVKAYDFHLTEAYQTATAQATMLQELIRQKNSGQPEKKEE